MIADNSLCPAERDVDAELNMARSSGSDGPTENADADLPFDAAAVPTYEARLESLREAVVELEAGDEGLAGA